MEQAPNKEKPIIQYMNQFFFAVDFFVCLFVSFEMLRLVVDALTVNSIFTNTISGIATTIREIKAERLRHTK